MNIPLDKRAHAWSGLALAMMLLYVLVPLYELTNAIAITIALVFVVARGKEYLDARRPDIHTSDPLDLLAGMVGCFVAVAFVLAVSFFVT